MKLELLLPWLQKSFIYSRVSICYVIKVTFRIYKTEELRLC